MKKIQFLLPIFLLVALPGWGMTVFAQSTGTISGEVTDISTGELLVGANVRIEGTNLGSATNVDGEFIIRNVPEGTHTLVASYLGYEPIEQEVDVTADETLELEIELQWGGMEGDEVTISVQAQGQADAINRQVQRRTISNIVSSDRIREVPDVNAAESIGRLPGVSIQRSGGEANMVAIRGLSPQYNAITVEGVRMPSTDAANRSVDLSMISPNMLEGIELTKANTPDLDADAIGGTVDLQLREAPEGFHTDLSLEGGYNQLQESYDNYLVSGSVSNRFFNDRLGAILNFNLEDRDRGTDTYNADYGLQRISEGQYQPRTDQLRLQDNDQSRSRQGASLILDYNLPNGRIALNSFYSTRINDEVIRSNLYHLEDQNHMYEMGINENNLTMTSNILAVENDFGPFNVHATGSYSLSRNHSPEDIFVDFMEPSAFGDIEDRNNPTTIPPAAYNRIEDTNLYTIGVSETQAEESNYAFQSNATVPFQLSDFISGNFEFGGKHSYTSRFNDEDGWNINLFYGGEDTAMDHIQQNFPELGLEEGATTIPMEPFLQDYERSNFLPVMDGDWPIGYTPNPDMIVRLHNLLNERDLTDSDGQSVPYYERDVETTFRNDYDGIENLWAGYALTEFDIGDHIMFMPGFRYEHMSTRFTAAFVREASIPDRGDPGGAIDPRTTERSNEFFLPMFHLRISPTDWMDVRLARTNTITRPDYMAFSPRMTLDFYGRYVFAGNPDLQPAESLNHDLSVSFYNNEIGLFTVSAFHKSVDGLIYENTYQDLTTEDGERIGDHIEFPGVDDRTHTVITSLNNPNEAFYQGIEFDWQTNFWWLPDPFSGIVLSANYTRIHSETEYRRFTTERIADGSPTGQLVVSDTTRTGRLPNQPNDVANVQIGYDLGGFSARVSFLYQGDTMQAIGNRQEADHLTADYFRIDARVRQELFTGFEVFANLNNINSRPDENFQSALGQFPTYNQNYGATFDIGVRYRY